MKPLTITLRHARRMRACQSGIDATLAVWPGLGDDDEVAVVDILDRVGIEEAMWALWAVGETRLLTDIACDIADHVAHLAGPAEQVCRTATRVARLHARGLASDRELVSGRDAARAAAYAATYVGVAADVAAYAAAYAATYAASATYAAAYAYADAASAYAAYAAADAASAYATYAAARADAHADAAAACAARAEWQTAVACEREWQVAHIRAVLERAS